MLPPLRPPIHTHALSPTTRTPRTQNLVNSAGTYCNKIHKTLTTTCHPGKPPTYPCFACSDHLTLTNPNNLLYRKYPYPNLFAKRIAQIPIDTPISTPTAHDTNKRKKSQLDAIGPPATHLLRTNQHHINELSTLGKKTYNPIDSSTTPDPHINLRLNTIKSIQNANTLNMSTNNDRIRGTDNYSGS